MNNIDWRVFVSYSNEDSTIVGGIVKILRAAFEQKNNATFWARDSIPPGEKWAQYLFTAIYMSERVFVFWCCHAKKSQWVRNEYEFALKMSKTVVPVMLDNTELPSDLAAIQAIDLSKTLIHYRSTDVISYSKLINKHSKLDENPIFLYEKVIIDSFSRYFEHD